MKLHELKNHYGDWALVTGASSGIGESFAEVLAELGFDLLLVARRENRLLELANSLTQRHGVEVETVTVDLGDLTAAEIIANRLKDKNVGLLISNAGYGFKGDFSEQNGDDLAAMVVTNCLAGANLAHRLIPGFKRRVSSGILFTGSVEGEVPVPHSAAYAASKAFIHSLGTALWSELKPFGIDVLVLAPGPTDTEAPGKQGISREQLSGLMSPRDVAEQALGQLGRGPLFIPGKLNSTMFSIMGRLPKSIAATLVGKGVQQAIRKSKGQTS